MSELRIRHATANDLSAIVRMLADDFLGQQRERTEDPIPDSYVKAFQEIETDPNNELIVAELDNEVIGTLQLTFTPSISFQGSRRCTVESVRVNTRYRGQGIGRKMMIWEIERAKANGCGSMQLTTNSERIDAHHFYENLGFKASHIGMKLKLK